MKAYLNSLTEKEKWMVVGGALCLFLYIYYLFLYSPLSNQVNQKSTQLIEKTETLAWMNKIRQQAHTSKKKQTLSNSQLLTTLAKELKNNGPLKFPYQLQQTSSGDIQLTFDEVPFQAFVVWLAKIDEQYTISVKQIEANQTQTPGITKLIMILSAANKGAP